MLIACLGAGGASDLDAMKNCKSALGVRATAATIALIGLSVPIENRMSPIWKRYRCAAALTDLHGTAPSQDAPFRISLHAHTPIRRGPHPGNRRPDSCYGYIRATLPYPQSVEDIGEADVSPDCPTTFNIKCQSLPTGVFRLSVSRSPQARNNPILPNSQCLMFASI